MAKVLAFDPSGNFKEGYGTTGWAFMENGKISEIGEIKAKKFKSAEAYWQEHIHVLYDSKADEVVMEGYRLYNHAGQEANKQSNSELETPQLIGCIKLVCWDLDIPLTIQWASEVKTRWSDKVLQAKGILDSGNKFKGKQTNSHKRDAMRHALHYWRYKR